MAICSSGLPRIPLLRQHSKGLGRWGWLLVLAWWSGAGCLLAQVSGASSPPPASAASETYVIQPLDSISFRVLGEPETDTQARVATNGMVALPYIGEVSVGGLTVSEARRQITARYVPDFYVNPQIQLGVVAVAERRVQVLGRVNRPGFVIILPEQEMTLIQAIAGAGDFAPLANRREILISRVGPDGSTEVERVDFDELTRPGSTRKVILRDGDTVRVQERAF